MDVIKTSFLGGLFEIDHYGAHGPEYNRDKPLRALQVEIIIMKIHIGVVKPKRVFPILKFAY
jgi:hypothetical protein